MVPMQQKLFSSLKSGAFCGFENSLFYARGGNGLKITLSAPMTQNPNWIWGAFLYSNFPNFPTKNR